MAEITLKINHRGYGIHCDEGQEERLNDLAAYVDSRLSDIAAAGAATNESHLLVLTSLVLADEVFDMREELASMQDKLQKIQDAKTLPVAESTSEEEVMVVEAIDYLANKLEHISNRLQLSELEKRAA